MAKAREQGQPRFAFMRRFVWRDDNDEVPTAPMLDSQSDAPTRELDTRRDVRDRKDQRDDAS